MCGAERRISPANPGGGAATERDNVRAKLVLRRLKIHRYRHVKPGVELTFNDRFNVLLGRNGTGKTTLLDLISVVVRCDFSRLRHEEFDLEFERGHPHGVATFRVKNEAEPVRQPNDVALPRGERAAAGRAYRPSLHVSFIITRLDGSPGFELSADRATLRWRGESETWTDGSPVELFSDSMLWAIAE
mgnify:CR=1 FL=1